MALPRFCAKALAKPVMRLLLNAMLAAICITARATEYLEWGPFSIQRYTAADGLVSSEITGSYRDSRGFIWIATFNGISRFDGHTFETYRRESGLAESNTDILGEDAAGRVFARSVANVYRFTGNGKRLFDRYPTSGAFIRSAAPDSAGNVWVCYEGKPGLSLLGPQSTLVSLSTQTPLLSLVQGADRVIYALEQSGDLYAVRAGRLELLRTLRPVSPYTGDGLTLLRAADGAAWCYAAGNAYAYKLVGGRIADSASLPAKTLWWEWTTGPTGTFYHMRDTGSMEQRINGRWQTILTKAQLTGSIYHVREESDGSLWVSTSNGLLHIRRKQYRSVPAHSPLAYFAAGGTEQPVLHSDSLLYHIPGAAAAFRSLEGQTITHVYVTREKEVWYATERAAYYLPYGKSLLRLPTEHTYAGKDMVFRFRRMLEDGAGGIWISSYHGVFHWKDKTLRYYFDREGITEGALYTIALDKSGTFYTAGIHVFAFTGGRFQDISGALRLPDEISRLATDHSGAVWVCQGTAKLVSIGNDGKRFFPADSLQLSVNGMPVSATSICFDEASNLWVCDDKSLYCYPAKGGRVNGNNPLFWNEQFSGSPLLYAGPDNQIQVVSHPLSGNYLRTYNAAALMEAYHPQTPCVLLTSVRLNKAAFDWQAAGFATDALGIPQGLMLRHNQNFLRFNFSGLLPDIGRAVAYRYRLNGYEEAWTPVSGEGVADYTGLPPGAYVFEVSAISPGSDWSVPLQYHFSIQAVWYLRWWAVALWLLLGALVISSLVYLRWRVVHQRAKLKQLLAEEQLKALRAQINPHFLQNTFAFLAHEMYGQNPSRAIKALDRISAYLRDVMNVSDKAWLSLEEELDFAEQYLRMQEMLLSTHFSFGFYVADDVDTFDTRVPAMLLQTVLENALKYGICPDGRNRIEVRIANEGDYVKCVVSDTGGAPNLASEPVRPGRTGKGLALTMERLALFYAGKTVEPQLYRQANAAGGSDVVIMLPIR